MLRPDLANSAPNDETPSAEVNDPRSKKPEVTYDLPYLAAMLAEHGGGVVSVELALDLILNQIVEEARLATGASGVAIALIRDNEMVCRGTAGSNAPDLGMHLDTESGLSGACVQSATAQISRDTETDGRVDPGACRQLGVRSILVLPLLDGAKLIGVFEILSPLPDAFGEREVHTLQAFARRIIHSTHEASEVPTLIARGVGPSSSRANQQISGNTIAISEPALEELVASEELRNPPRHVRRHRPDLLKLVLGALLGVALLLGWTLARSTWRNLPLSRIGESGPKGQDPARQQSRALSVPAKLSENNGPVERTVIASTAKPLLATRGAPRGTPPPGSLVVYQNGKVIFEMSPATQASGAETFQQHTESRAAPSPDETVNRALKTESTSKAKLLQISREVAASRLIHRVQPQYPSEARELRVQGPVVLHAFINKQGAVQELKVVSGDPRLADASVEAVKQWRFQPYLVNGRLVDVETDITLNYRLP